MSCPDCAKATAAVEKWKAVNARLTNELNDALIAVDEMRGALGRLVKAWTTNAHPDGETDEVYPDWAEVQEAFKQAQALLAQ